MFSYCFIVLLVIEVVITDADSGVCLSLVNASLTARVSFCDRGCLWLKGEESNVISGTSMMCMEILSDLNIGTTAEC